MRSYLPALFLLLLAACASGERSEPGLRGRVTYEMSSWGRLLTHWQVDPDGSGEFWRGSGLGNDDGEVISKFRMTLNSEALHAFVAAVEPIRARTAAGIKCQDEWTDMPYGSITWDYPGARQKYSFDGGCRSPKANAMAEQLQAVHDIVEKRATIEAKPYIVQTMTDR